MTSDNTPAQLEHKPNKPFRSFLSRRAAAVAALIAAVGVGIGISAVAMPNRPTILALAPAAIATLKGWEPMAVRGEVTEIFGNKFIVQDGSGRALVETGHAGEGGGFVKKTETVTVQGRFENGFIHAQAITHANGHADVFGPPHAGPYAPNPFAWLHMHWPHARG